MERWVEIRKGGDFTAIGQKFSIRPITARIIRNRGLISMEEVEYYLNGSMDRLHNPRLLKDMERMCDILEEKINTGKKIRVLGDYDIDGVCATYLLKTGLKRAGAHADAVIPHRIRDGYGMNEQLIREAFEDGVDTIITCDNGISAIDEIAYGRSLGMTILVTDHHEVPYEEINGIREYKKPECDAIVDPKQMDCEYPFKGLCGAGVAYKLICGLYRKMNREQLLEEEWIEMVAFATIGDVMELTDENRIIVRYGLEQMQNTSNMGLKALIDITGLSVARLSPYHIGYILGPCMNATGRLDTAQKALALLEAKSMKEAAGIAADLKAMNDSRKEMTQRYLNEAIRQIEEEALCSEKVLVLYLPECHESIAGIIAGRIRERYYRPVFVLTDGENNVKGSGRSIESYHMYEEMTKCKELFLQYGGHKMAAGLSLKKENLELFRQKINEVASLDEEDLYEKVPFDMILPFSELTLELVEEFSCLEPFGTGNARPVFAARDVILTEGKVLGKSNNVLKLKARQGSAVMEAIYFGEVMALLETIESREKLNILYYPDINEYGGRKTLQIVVKKYQ